MDEKDYLEELEFRLLSYLDGLDKLRPSQYKHLDRFKLQYDVYKDLIKTTKNEILRVEKKIKEEQNGRPKPRIY